MSSSDGTNKAGGRGRPAASGSTAKPSSLRWLGGWVLLPGLLLGLLFLAGMHVGARHPELWFVRGFVWLFSLVFG